MRRNPEISRKKKLENFSDLQKGVLNHQRWRINGKLATAKGWRSQKMKPRSDGRAGGVQTTHLPVLCNQGCVLACIVHPKAPTVLNPVVVWRGGKKDKPFGRGVLNAASSRRAQRSNIPLHPQSPLALPSAGSSPTLLIHPRVERVSFTSGRASAYALSHPWPAPHSDSARERPPQAARKRSLALRNVALSSLKRRMVEEEFDP